MKRVTAIFLIPIILLFGSSCASDARFGIFELERRIKEENEIYAFDTEGMFRREGVYHIFYRTEKGTLLLKVKEDDKQRVCFLSLTTADTDEETATYFSALACILSDVFLPQDVRSDARSLLRLDDPRSFFRDETLTGEFGRYKAVFFKSVQGASILLSCS